MGTKKSVNMEAASAITPPNFLGIDRRMAYANRKYHSGWMWTGVTSGLAGLNFSGSFRSFGDKSAIDLRHETNTINPVISFVEK